MSKIIIERPNRLFGIYAFINIKEKAVYVGESCDLNRRLSEHLRSLYGMEDSSNKNLVNAFRESNSEFVGTVLYYADDYNKSGKDLKWLIDETIYMYVFVKYGFSLYNGEEEYKANPHTLTDNLNGKRSFLRGAESDLENGLFMFYKDINQYGEEYNDAQIQKELEEYIGVATANIKNTFKKLFGEEIDYENLIKSNDNEYRCIYNNDSVFTLEKDSKQYKVNKIANKISTVYLNKKDLEKLGLKRYTRKNLMELVDNDCLDRIAVCGAGDYLDQSIMTILLTKQYDITHNSMTVEDEDVLFNQKEEGKTGICFWALGLSKVNDIREYLIENNQNKDTKYLIMPYTPNTNYNRKIKHDYKIFNPKDDISVEEFFVNMRSEYDNRKNKVINNDEHIYEIDRFAFGYAWDRKNANNKSGKKKAYPNTMFPEIINKFNKEYTRRQNNIAFLISELGFIDGKIDNSVFKWWNNCSTGNLVSESLKGSNNFAIGEINNKEDLNNYFDDLKENDEVKFLIAKIEYPYVIALINDPID